MGLGRGGDTPATPLEVGSLCMCLGVMDNTTVRLTKFMSLTLVGGFLNLSLSLYWFSSWMNFWVMFIYGHLFLGVWNGLVFFFYVFVAIVSWVFFGCWVGSHDFLLIFPT